jgi:hypothetical protein
MEYPLNLPGFEGRQLSLQTAGFFSGPKLLLDGQPAPPGPKRGQFALRRNDGTQAVAELRNPLFIDPVPQVVVDGKPHQAAAPLKWYQWVWAGAPLVLLAVGGALGGVLGALAMVVNGRIFRTGLNGVLKYAITGVVSFGAVIVWFGVALVLSLLLNN